MNTFGERLKHLRGSQSQATFAKVFGIPQMTLSNYETGKSEPKFGLIATICTQFSISSDWLLFGRGPMRPSAHAEEAQPTALASSPPPLSPARRPAGSATAPQDHAQPVATAPPTMFPAMPATMPTGMPPVFSESPCPRCLKLDSRLEEMERERRELTVENRQLWRENATLREENATLRERQYQQKSGNASEAVGGLGA